MTANVSEKHRQCLLCKRPIVARTGGLARAVLLFQSVRGISRPFLKSTRRFGAVDVVLNVPLCARAPTTFQNEPDRSDVRCPVS